MERLFPLPPQKFFCVPSQSIFHPWSHWPLICFLSLWTRCVLSRVSYKWNYIVCTLLCLASFTQYNVSEGHPCCWTVCLSCLSLCSIPLCALTTICWSILQLIDIWIVSSFELLLVKLLGTILSRSFCGHRFLFLLGHYPGLDLLSHRMGIYLTLLETHKQFSKVSESLHTLTSSVWENKDGPDHSDKLPPAPYVGCSSILFITELEKVEKRVSPGMGGNAIIESVHWRGNSSSSHQQDKLIYSQVPSSSQWCLPTFH